MTYEALIASGEEELLGLLAKFNMFDENHQKLFSLLTGVEFSIVLGTLNADVDPHLAVMNFYRLFTNFSPCFNLANVMFTLGNLPDFNIDFGLADDLIINAVKTVIEGRFGCGVIGQLLAAGAEVIGK